MPNASSTARTLVSAWQPVHTPQMRSTASTGIARIAAFQNHFQPAPHGAGGHRVADDVVAVKVDLAAHVASMRVTGSTTMRRPVLSILKP